MSLAPVLQLMQLSSLLELDLDDTLSLELLDCAQALPSLELEGLADDVHQCSLASPGSAFIDMYPEGVRRRSLGSPGSSFIDMYPADEDELFTVRWTSTTAAASDFEFDDLPLVHDGTASPVLLPSPTPILCGGLLLPCEPGDAADVAPSVPQRQTPSSCSGSKLGSRQTTTVCACGTPSFSPPWKVFPSCWRFSGMLCRKVSAQRLRPRDVAPAAACPTLGSTSSAIQWCHGSANTAVDDAILYCKKSSGQNILSD